MKTKAEIQYKLNIALDTGDGEQTIVYLHGINGNGQSFAKVADRLNMTRRRVIAPDMLGYGESPKPLDIDYTIDDHVDALHYTLENMKLTKPFILVGYSMGGVIAPRYASRYPQNVAQLILISAPFYLKPGDMTDSRYVKSVFATEIWKKTWEFARHLSSRHKRTFQYLSSENVNMVQGIINSKDLATDWPIFQKCIHNTIEKSTLGDDLEKIKCPTSFVVGRKDSIVVTDQLEALLRYKPDLEIRRIKTIKADHFMLDTLPGQIAAEIERAIDVKIHVAEDRGEGEAVVFLHGIEGSADYWHDYITTLQESHRVVSLDLLGFGRSSKPLNLSYGISDQVKYLAEVFERLHIERATVVGHSLGSLIGLGFAASYPSYISKLIMIEPVITVVGDKDSEPKASGMANLKHNILSNLDIFRQKTQLLLQKNVVRDVLGEERMQNYLPTLRSIENVVEKQNVSRDITAVSKLPIDIIYGSRDAMVAEANIIKLDKKFNNLSVTKLDAGHNAPLQRPIECMKLIAPNISESKIRQNFSRRRVKNKNSINSALRKSSILLLFRGAVNLIFGLGLIFGNYPARLLVIGVVAYVFINSLTILTQSITLRNERFNWLISAIMGIIGFALGIYLMLEPQTSIEILFTVVGLYMLAYGIMNILVGVMVKNGQRPVWQLYSIGFLYVIMGGLLLAQNNLGIKLVGLGIALAAAATGLLLIGYATLTYSLSRSSVIRPKF